MRTGEHHHQTGEERTRTQSGKELRLLSMLVSHPSKRGCYCHFIVMLSSNCCKLRGWASAGEMMGGGENLGPWKRIKARKDRVPCVSLRALFFFILISFLYQDDPWNLFPSILIFFSFFFEGNLFRDIKGKRIYSTKKNTARTGFDVCFFLPFLCPI